VGHAGTLDPGATGVLPVLIGEATKLTPYLMDQDKEYVATVRFGLTTDTLDVSGRVLSETAVFRLERYLLEEACRPFVGRIKQVPPMYSAVHHAGRRLYELAREGIEVDREPREVVVRSIVVDEVAPPRATLRVVCGKGTYVRVLAADLGAALGYGGAVERLVRGLESYPPGADPRVVVLGAFDGIHLGHRAILGTAVAQARLSGLQALACTFDPHPLEVLQPERSPVPITTLEERLELIAETGIDTTVVVPFTRAVAVVEPEDFVRRVVVGTLKAQDIVVGFNDRFVRGARGDAALLE